MNTNKINNEYPWLVFTLNSHYYAVTSKVVSTILRETQDLVSLPETPIYHKGIFHLRGKVIPLIDLRTLFSLPSLEEEFETFKTMIEQGKKDHINWVNTLDNSVQNNEAFLLSKDPHQWAFGKWYDQFSSPVESINFHMKKIDEPHKALHHTATNIESCKQKSDKNSKKECIEKTMSNLKETLTPELLALLDESKNILRTAYHSIIIVLEQNGVNVGIMVDEVMTVESIHTDCDQGNFASMSNTPYLKAVARDKKNQNFILILDEENILNNLSSTQ